MKFKYNLMTGNDLFNNAGYRITDRVYPVVNRGQNNVSVRADQALAESLIGIDSGALAASQLSTKEQSRQEWRLWQLKCGLIEQSHGTVSRSGLYMDFT